MRLPMEIPARWAIGLVVESWRAESESLAPRRAGEGASPILLLHGFGGTPRMLRPLARYLRRELERPSFEPALGVGLGDIRDVADRVYRELVERGVGRCDVVAYSMGGLVATYLAKCLDQGRRIRRVVTLGTPHRGVPLVSDWRLRWASPWRSAAQMREGSPFLEQLAELPLPAGVDLVSIAGSADPLVPVRVARLAGEGCNVIVPGVDHWRMLTSRRVYRCVRDGLVARESVGSHRDRGERALRSVPAASGR